MIWRWSEKQNKLFLEPCQMALVPQKTTYHLIHMLCYFVAGLLIFCLIEDTPAGVSWITFWIPTHELNPNSGLSRFPFHPRRSAASMVWVIRVTMVIGPTPPGTGV